MFQNLPGTPSSNPDTLIDPAMLDSALNRRDTWLGFGNSYGYSDGSGSSSSNSYSHDEKHNHNRDSQPESCALAANGDHHYHQRLPTGFGALDARLCEQGWPLGTCIEVLTDACGMGAMGLFLPAMERLSEQQRCRYHCAGPVPYSITALPDLWGVPAGPVACRCPGHRAAAHKACKAGR